MGRPTKPTALKIVSGTDQPCRVRVDEPKPKTDNLRKPRGMSKKANKHWNHIKAMLLECRVLTNADTYLLAMLCTAITEMFEIQALMDDSGVLIKGRHDYPVISPYFRALRLKQQEVKSILVEFGMTPAARTRVGTTSDDSAGEFDF